MSQLTHSPITGKRYLTKDEIDALAAQCEKDRAKRKQQRENENPQPNFDDDDAPLPFGGEIFQPAPPQEHEDAEEAEPEALEHYVPGPQPTRSFQDFAKSIADTL